MWRQLQTRDSSVIPERALKVRGRLPCVMRYSFTTTRGFSITLKAVESLEEALSTIRLDNPQASAGADGG